MHSKQGFPALTSVYAMWLADAGGGPQPRSSPHRDVSGGVGEEVPTCSGCAFLASPGA